jgi:predicted lysophospholipase L1 biosynthesis ABC-type transport system permease subunit
MASYCARVEQSTCVVTNQRPNGISGYASIDGTPEILAGVLAVLGLAVLTQLIVLSGRHHRLDFAILKSLGLLRRQVSSITAWQVSTLVALALLAGLPLGVAAGRWAWGLFAGGLGVPSGALIPATVILVIAPAVLVAANLVAFWPGRTTARLHPGEVLRAE